MYDEILRYADIHRLELTGFAFEQGLNEFAIQSESEYVTMIEIACIEIT